MKKKLFSVLLISMLAISLLAGCNNKKVDNKEDKNVTESTETTKEEIVSADGITVTGLMGDAEKVEMSALTDGDDYKSAMDFAATLTDKNITATEVYNIDLLDKDSKKVQPEKSVNINLKLSDNMLNAEGDGYEVYRREDDSTFKKLNTTVSNNEVGFTTEHFSIYVLVKTSSTTIAVGEPDSEAADNGEADQNKIEEAENNPAAFTFTSKSGTMYTTSSVNVRSGPDSYFEKIASLPKGQAVNILNQCNETGWYQVDIGDAGAAFVSNNYLTTEQPKQSTSSNTTTNNTTTNTATSNDNSSNSTPAQDTPAQQPEQPAPANNCPYPLLTVTTYNGYTGFFYTWDQVGTEECWNAYNAACQAVGGGNNGSMHVGVYDDTGDVYFCSVWK